MRTAIKTRPTHKDDGSLELPLAFSPPPQSPRKPLSDELSSFREFGAATRKILIPFRSTDGQSREVPGFVNEFWTAKQRQAHSLHEISYRACFKPQLPSFFIERLSQPGDFVYDPFMGRGTTPLEAALLGRVPIGNDVNPLSLVMTRPRLHPPTFAQVEARLQEIDLDDPADMPRDLLVFYHPETLKAISSLKRYLLERRKTSELDAVDDWLALVALNRLTGHSGGFFSVYTLPPNQAVSVKSQRKINRDRQQTPPRRHLPALILKKTRDLLKDCSDVTRQTLSEVADHALLLTQPSSHTPEIRTDSVALVVTSPPFLNVVDYSTDNWLRSLSVEFQGVTEIGTFHFYAATAVGLACRPHRPGRVWPHLSSQHALRKCRRPRHHVRWIQRRPEAAFQNARQHGRPGHRHARCAHTL